jgi:ferredoxin-nitrite reductase
MANPGSNIPKDAGSSDANHAAEQKNETYFGTPVKDLCEEERWKREEDALDISDKLRAHANEDRFPEGGDVFRFKFQGLFYVSPAQDSLMLRLRMPGGILTAHQMRGLAEMAEDLGSGEAYVTTRGNLQLREFRPKDIVHVLSRVESLGMNALGSGADNVRNITATPTSGIDPVELFDVVPLAQSLNQYILESRDLYGLPRKVNIAFDSGGATSVVADTNDLAFIATRVSEGHSVSEGVYFRVHLGGTTSHRQFASDSGLLIAPEQTVAVAAAMLRVYIENGDRTNRKRARLKYLIDRWGMEKFLEETAKRLAFPLTRFPLAECEPRPTVDQRAHLGVHAQRQPGLSYIGVAVPVGRLSAGQMRAIASIADEFGSSEIRLTVMENLILPNIADEVIQGARQAIAAAGLNDDAGSFTAAAISCTGSQGCRFSPTDTQTHALQLARFLDDRFKVRPPISLRVTGCPHCCAQPYIGDIGLMGTIVAGEEGYEVWLGGGSDECQGLGRELISIRFRDLPPLLERLIQIFEETRKVDESFVEFTRRHKIEELRELLSCRP